MTNWSLRLRLTLIILLPLCLIATLVGLWQMNAARTQAAELFDRSLLSSALAVSEADTLAGKAVEILLKLLRDQDVLVQRVARIEPPWEKVKLEV